MAKVRYTAEVPARFVDRHGTAIEVASITLVLPSRDEIAGCEQQQLLTPESASSDSEGTRGPTTATSQLTPNRSTKRDGVVGETQIDSQVAELWAYWVARREPRRRELEPSQAKLIAKALKVAEVDELKRAIDALLADDWHRDKGLLNLSTLFATKPHGPTLRDQIDRWLDRASTKQATTVRRVTGELLGETTSRRHWDPGAVESLIRVVRSNALRPPYDSDDRDVEYLEQQRFERRDEAVRELRERWGVLASFTSDNDRDVSFAND